MSASRINHELDILDEISSGLMDMMIEVGRGLERFSETRKKNDELSNKINELNDRYRALRIEMECRYGKDCPYRLPIKRGAFGPIKPLVKVR